MRIDSIGKNPNVQQSSSIKNSEISNDIQNETASSSISNEVNYTQNQAKSEIDNEEILQKSVEQANKSLEKYNKVIEREVHEVTKTMLYRLKDSKTGEVIREFPPKKFRI